jgi:tryptophan synthase alpha chain
MARLAMVSVSIVERMGTSSFVRAAAAAGFDGLIVPDADLLASDRLAEACGEADIACAFLVAPTSTPARVAEIVRRCRGFVYLLARAGVTGDASAANGTSPPAIVPHAAGADARVPRVGTTYAGLESAGSSAAPRAIAPPPAGSTLARQVAVIRAVNPSLPIAAGFGIATPADVAATLSHVDAAIVGTALVRRIRAAAASGADPVEEAERFVAALADAARAAAEPPQAEIQ